MRTTLLALATGGVLVAGLALPASADHGKLVVTGLTANDHLVTFPASAPTQVGSDTPVTGVLGDLQGIDFRPATGGLYGLGLADDGARLYLIDTATGVATQVGTAVYAITGNISIDFNPNVDRLRVVSDDGTNLRVNPNNGALASTDGDLAYVAGDVNEGTAARVGGVAYTKNDSVTGGGTTLFDIDAGLDQLVKQDPPNAGGLQTQGVLPAVTKAQATGFDIYTRTNGDRDNWAFVTLFDKGRTTFYEIPVPDDVVDGPLLRSSGTQLTTTPHVTDIAVRPAQAGL